MKATVLAHRYARALFELAVEKKILDTIIREFSSFRRIIEGSPPLKHFFNSPEAGKAGKRRFIENNFQDRFSALFINFIFVLLEKGRQNQFDEIAREFSHLCDKHYNRKKAMTITAVPLSKRDREKIRRKLSDQYGAAFEVENYVDPEILGGVILNIEGKVVDTSLRNQLAKLKSRMLSNHS